MEEMRAARAEREAAKAAKETAEAALDGDGEVKVSTAKRKTKTPAKS
jgi:hypothetical protein